MRAENRKNIRRQVRQGARLVDATGAALGTCQMVDLSGTGARLRVDAADAIPDQFTLVLSHDGRLRRRCSVAWRSENAIGVRFLDDRSAKKG